jgi:hypothetical protein
MYIDEIIILTVIVLSDFHCIIFDMQVTTSWTTKVIDAYVYFFLSKKGKL